MKKSMMWIIAVFVSGTIDAMAFDLYFLRHAQTQANVTREYTPENQQTFSPWGLEQVNHVAGGLADYEFDVVIVSPAWRTMHTILPVLMERGMQAEIWPELYECCWDRETVEDDPQVTRGEAIEIDPAFTTYFRLRDAESGYILEVDTPARGELMVAGAVELLLERFAGTEQRVLMVSHYHTGGRILRNLLGESAPARIQPQNARLTHLRGDEEGQFSLLMLNAAPVE